MESCMFSIRKSIETCRIRKEKNRRGCSLSGVAPWWQKFRLVSSFAVRVCAVCLVMMGLTGCGYRSMVRAVETGDLPRVKSLVARNARLVDARIIGGFPSDLPVLHAAIDCSHFDVAEFLIDSGADVNARDNLDKTALHYAIERGSDHLAKLLLDSGADPLAVDHLGESALYRAIQQRNNPVTALLRTRGADDVPVLHQAVAFEDGERVSRLLLGNPQLVNQVDAFGETPLHYAAERGNVAVTQLLLDAGANVHAQSKSARTALFGAVLNGHAGLTRLLLSHGASKDFGAKGHNNMLHTGVGSGNEDVVAQLLAHGIKLDARDDFGETALMKAAYTGVSDEEAAAIAGLLLDAGAPVNEQSKEDRRTALHLAAFFNKPLFARMLLQRGADVSWRDADGSTALDIAEKRGNGQVAKAIRAFSSAQ